MIKLFVLPALTVLILIQAAPAFCGISKKVVFQLSVTIPPHIISNNLKITPFSNNPYQLVQTQTELKNNKIIRLTSIVVP